jgi:hypothetical protein
MIRQGLIHIEGIGPPALESSYHIGSRDIVPPCHGICVITGYGPAGYPYNCMGDPGQLVIPPNMSTVCGTQLGMCPVLPVYGGSLCFRFVAPHTSAVDKY